MKSEPVIVERTFNASINDIWEAITDKEKMKHWYFNIKSFKAEVGFEFDFIDGPEHKKYVHLCKITTVDKNKKLAYLWKFEGIPGESLVTFELFAEDEKTRLRLTHEGIENFKTDDEGFTSEDFNEGWNHIIGKSLKEFVEKN